MSDWDFLHDMGKEGYSPDQIAEAAACGYNPYEPIDLKEYGLEPDEWEAIEEGESHQGDLSCNPAVVEIFEDLVHSAAEYHAITGRYLQIWGELGELFAEITYGIQRHKPGTQGSDGKLGNDFVEIKTISPEKSVDEVRVKRSGNFNRLLIVKISDDFAFEGRLIARKALSKGEGKHMRAPWPK